MNRLIVTNSALAYPPPPEDLLGPGDAVLPLVETFDEAMFMPSEFYEGLSEEITPFNLSLQATARELARLLPEPIGAVREEWGHSAFEGFMGSFLKFTLGPLMTNALVAGRAAETSPAEVLAWDEPRHESWWGGRQMVAEVAREIADRTGARLSLRVSGGRRLVRDLALPALSYLRATQYFVGRARHQSHRPAQPCDVLIPVVGPSVTPVAQRIARQLLDAHGLRTLAVEIPQEPSDAGLAPPDLPSAHLYSYTTRSMLAQAHLEILASCGWRRRTADALQRRPGLLDLGPHLTRALLRRLHNVLGFDMPVALYHARLWKRVLDEASPRVVVSPNFYSPAIAAGVLQAKARDIPTMLCPHGMGGPHYRSGTLLPYDEALVFGEFAGELLASIADDETEFTVTGHSLYDDLRLPADEPATVPEPGALVLATTQPMEPRLRAAEPTWWLRSLASACADLEARMLIKPHPQETDLAPYRELAGEMPETVTVAPHGERPLEELIGECAVLVTRYSTTAMQAAIQGRPVLTVFPTGGRERYPFAAEGAALKVDSCEAIAPALRGLLENADLRARLAQDRRRFLQRHVGVLDGGATARIADAIAARAAGS
jgi:hypothetical protein